MDKTNFLGSLCAFQAQLGYRFKATELLIQALTHKSVSGSPLHNERLEFLGDAILSYLIAEHLYDRYPAASEGLLTHMRARLVCGETLKKISNSIGLNRILRVKQSEPFAKEMSRHASIADALEALIGAIYLDGGKAVTKELVLGWYQPLLRSLKSDKMQKDYKTSLQERQQQQGYRLPQYAVEQIYGLEHQQRFEVSCRIEPFEEQLFLGTGRTKRAAEQMAAKRALRFLGAAHD